MDTEVGLNAFYVTGGTLPTDASCYIVRQADEDLLQSLRRGEFCYVLNTRQMGKSSLMVRIAERLRSEGVRVVALDITSVGQNLTPEQWYIGLLGRIGEQLDLEAELYAFWNESRELGPLQRWLDALRRVVLARLPSVRIVLFIDEIDAVRSLPFSGDEFFAGIRECYNRRAQDLAFKRLTFCLLGVATPSDLIRDSRMSPFNIGRRIVLSDFTPEEANPLRVGLSPCTPIDVAPLFARIFYWTGGHPYMTQRLCRAVAEDSSAPTPQAVDRLCESLFLSQSAQETDDNLAFVRNRLIQSGVDLAALLDLYTRVRRGRPVKEDETDPLYTVLRLAGVVRAENGVLKVRNRIYDRVFDRAWVRAHMPDAERRRQRRAYILGALRTAAVTGTVTLAMAALALLALHQAQEARRARDDARQQAHEVSQGRDRARNLNLQLEQALRSRDSVNRRLEAALTSERIQHRRADAQAEAALKAQASADAQAVAAGRARASADARRIEAESARQDALEQKRLATARLARLDLAEGMRQIDDGDLLGALAPLVESMRLDSGDPERTHIHRLRLASVLERTPRLLQVWFGQGALRWAEFSPEGARVVTADTTGCIRIWSVESGKPLTPEMRQPGGVAQASFSPDGHRLATADEDGTARVWNAATGRLICHIAHPSGVVTVAWSPEGHRLVIGGGEWLTVWDLTSEASPIQRFQMRYVRAKINRVAFNPEGDRVVVLFANFAGRFVDARTGDDKASLYRCYMGNSIAFSPDGKYALVAGNFGGAAEEKGAVLIDARTGKKVLPVLTHSGDGIEARFSSDGTRIVTAGRDQTVRVWDARTGQPLMAPIHHRAPVVTAQFSPDGRQILTGGTDGAAHLWDVATGQPLGPPLKQAGGLVTATFDPGGGHVLTAGTDTTARLWSPTDWEGNSKLLGSYTFLRTHQLLPNGRIFAQEARARTTAIFNRRLDILDPQTGTGNTLVSLPADASANVQPFHSTSLSRDGEHVALFGEHGISVFQTRTGVLCLSLPAFDRGQISPDGHTLLVQKTDGPAQFWSIDAHRAIGRPFAVADSHAGVSPDQAAFRPDSRMAATRAPQGGVLLWDTATGRSIGPMLWDGARINHMEFSPDGRMLFAWSDGGNVQVWSTVTFRPTSKRIEQAPPFSQPVVYSPAGDRALTPSTQLRVSMILWDLTTGRPIPTPAPLPAGDLPTFSPDGRFFTLAASPSCVWNAASGSLQCRIAVEWAAKGIRFAPDSRRLVSLGADSVARVWDAVTGRVLTPPMAHPRSIVMGDFSPDGRLLVTVCDDGAARLWDSTTGEAVSPPLRVADRIDGAQFLPSGDRLITYGAHDVRLWTLNACTESQERLVRLSKLLSGQRAADPTRGFSTPSPAEVRAIWQEFHPIAPPHSAKR